VIAIEFETEGARQLKKSKDLTLSHMTQKHRDTFGIPLRVIELHAGTNHHVANYVEWFLQTAFDLDDGGGPKMAGVRKCWMINGSGGCKPRGAFGLLPTESAC
jgi:hypothetical protein